MLQAYQAVCAQYPTLDPETCDYGAVLALRATTRQDAQTILVKDAAMNKTAVVTQDRCSLCTLDEDPGEDDIPFSTDPPCAHLFAAALFQATEAGSAPDSAPQRETVPMIRHKDSGSMTVKVQNPQGYEWLVCVRDDTDVDQLFSKARHAMEKIQEYGWLPAGSWHKAQPQAPQPAPVSETASQPQQQAPVAPAPVPVTQAQTQTPPQGPATAGSVYVFHTSHMTANMANGAVYWNVFGPDMPRACAKFGVRIWQEGLATAGFDATKLNPQAPPDLSGYLAHYVLRTDDSGRPDKVIRLEKMA